ncbi:hypothetical protein MRS44_008239 [Fusarium solani]|nr:hypothetical protein MRS44_008239 [Fusarium solani]
MSTPFLHRQDIESWVSGTAAPIGSTGFLAELSTTFVRAIASLRAVLFGSQDEACRMCQNELERFTLWCQGLGVTDGRLDQTLLHSKELRHQVLSLFLHLGTAVLQVTPHVSAKLSQLPLHECDHLRNLLHGVKAMLGESNSIQDERPDTPSGSDTSDYGLVETLEEVSAYIDCLLDLAPALDNPALGFQTDNPEEVPLDAKESITVSCKEALIYCRKIRDRFDGLPKYLVERLAEANVGGAANIRKMRCQATEKETLANDDTNESLFSGRRPQITETINSSVPHPSVFSSTLASSSKWLAPLASDFARLDDNASEATFASFSTTGSSIDMGRPRVPPMPDVQENGFDCIV